MKKYLQFLLLVISPSLAFDQQNLQWKFEIKGRVYASPQIAENYLFIGSSDSVFYALDKTSGAKFREFRTKGAIQSSACISGNLVFFGSADGNLYAIGKTTGKPV